MPGNRNVGRERASWEEDTAALRLALGEWEKDMDLVLTESQIQTNKQVSLKYSAKCDEDRDYDPAWEETWDPLAFGNLIFY